MDKPTRARGDDTPHTLELVITDEFFYKICVGKSDHSVFRLRNNSVKKHYKTFSTSMDRGDPFEFCQAKR